KIDDITLRQMGRDPDAQEPQIQGEHKTLRCKHNPRNPHHHCLLRQQCEI
ncbi:hypothetical protein HN873_012391, partial [Arachis hypogaea]